MALGWLLIQEWRVGEWAHRIREGTLSVGRSPLADLHISHPSVSRDHAIITADGGSCRVQDLNSQNGTKHNGQTIQRATFKIGDRLHFGAIEVFVVSDLDKALRELSAVGSTVEASQLTDDGRTLLKGITSAQRKVLRWMLRGLSEKQIAAELELSPHTVHNHVKQIYSGLEVRSRPELMAKYWCMWEDI